MPSTASDASPRAGSPQVTKYPIRPDDGSLRKKPRRAFAPRSAPFPRVGPSFRSRPTPPLPPQPPPSPTPTTSVPARRGTPLLPQGQRKAREGAHLRPAGNTGVPPPRLTEATKGDDHQPADRHKPPCGRHKPDRGGNNPKSVIRPPCRVPDSLSPALQALLSCHRHLGCRFVPA